MNLAEMVSAKLVPTYGAPEYGGAGLMLHGLVLLLLRLN
jgi:hypothetical protein